MRNRDNHRINQTGIKHDSRILNPHNGSVLLLRPNQAFEIGVSNSGNGQFGAFPLKNIGQVLRAHIAHANNADFDFIFIHDPYPLFQITPRLCR